MTSTDSERFTRAYDTLVDLGATTRSVDVTQALGFTRPDREVSLMTATGVDPTGKLSRAIGYLVVDQLANGGELTCMVNAFCDQAGQVTAAYAANRHTVPDQTGGVEPALVLIERALNALSVLGR